MINHHQTIKCLLLVSCLFLSDNVIAKAACKEKKAKLHQVQVKQRQGYSLKKGQSLRAQEDKARKAWWQCEQGKKQKRKKQKRKKRTKKKKHTHRK